jgi:hypothetical protein
MATSTSNPKAILLAAGLAFGAQVAVASNYQPYPDTSPGTVYRWKTYRVEENGKRTLRGIYTDTIQGKTLIGEHEYIVVQRANPEKKALPPIVYRADDQLFGVLLGPTEESLLVNWKGSPSVGQSWMRGSMQVVIRGQQDVEAEGVSYPDCFVLDMLRDGTLADRSYFDREAGWIETILYRDGKPLAISYRLPEGER